MEFGKQVSSDSSSDEYDPQEVVQLKDDTDHDPTKRPYECTFCKRGFTNAQALGGHMNIHRKDRAKAKAKHRFNSASSHSNAHYNDQFESSSRYFAPISSQPAAAATTAYYPAANYEAAHRNSYRMYFESPAAANYPIHRPRSQSLSVNEELLGANLSLQIDQTRSVWKNEELDLELRLGHEYR